MALCLDHHKTLPLPTFLQQLCKSCLLDVAKLEVSWSEGNPYGTLPNGQHN